jgi:hypothetical protein
MRTVTETLIGLQAPSQFVALLVLHNDLVIEGADILGYGGAAVEQEAGLLLRQVQGLEMLGRARNASHRGTP